MGVGKKTAKWALLAGAASLPILPALAQEGGGVLYTFGISQDLETGKNLELDVPEAGTSTFADTNLSFGVLSQRENENLDLAMGTSLTVKNTPESGGRTDTGLDNSFLNLSYDRKNANSAFTATATYNQTSVDRLNLSDFIGSDGVLVLPEDFGNLNGNANRTSYNAALGLQLGTSAPVGFNLDMGTSGITYTNNTDPDLFDYNRTFVSGAVPFKLSPVLTGTLGLAYTTYDAQDDGTTYTSTLLGSLGFEYQVSTRTSVNLQVAANAVKTDEFGLTTLDVVRPNGSLGFAYAMPDGQYTGDMNVTTDTDTGDQRLNVVFGRDMTLPTGALSFSLGFTAPKNGTAAPIGSLNWQRDMKDAQLSVQFRSYVTVANNDETQMATDMAVRYNHRINDISSYGLTALYGLTDATQGQNAVNQTELAATYQRSLTRDWALNTGVTYQIRDENNVGTAYSPSVFVSLGRNWTFRP